LSLFSTTFDHLAHKAIMVYNSSMVALRQSPLKLSTIAGSPHLRLMAAGARAFTAGESDPETILLFICLKTISLHRPIITSTIIKEPIS
jgi:hypothetical protein